MSTPNDSPDPTPEDRRPSQAGQNPQYGQPQNPQYGQPQNPGSAQAPYGGQSAPAAGYNYPGNAADTAVMDKGPAPKNVDTAYWLTLAAGALYLITSIIGAGMGGDSMGMGGGAGIIGIIVAVIVTAVYVLLAVFIRKGQNWARITATVLAALNVISLVFSLIVLVAASGMNDPAIQNSMAAVSPVNTVLSLIVTILGVLAVILLWTKPARPYFRRAQPAGYSQY